MAKLNTLCKHHMAMVILHKENHALKQCAAAADEMRETVVCLKAEAEAARAEHKAQYVSLLPQASVSNFLGQGM